ncbi:AAA family ATPase [Catellatospora coxensis]|uniref:ATPase AAA n=1 Tax=Catellatospora coxensis TaxID=310354 RepID=A0A8J3P888_9ACTN|nr:ATPase AAA [Catellatospora coxensis]
MADNVRAEPPAWWIFDGGGRPHDRIEQLPAPPPWRKFDGDGDQLVDATIPRHIGANAGAALRPDRHTVDLVNAAIYLRRPLFVSGAPGTGKSTLAYSIAHELGLGAVLHWPITSRSTLLEGLYLYDAIGRMQERNDNGTVSNVGDYIRLGPLGTALLDADRPRVLLIDEIDKCDVDLPNDLLHVFEEGTFVVPELERLPDDPAGVEVFTADPGRRHRVVNGRVRCQAFPIVVMTSNREREFPAAFQRRCLRLHLDAPDGAKLTAIVAAHLGQVDDVTRARIEAFLGLHADGRDRAIDQLLNLLFLARSGRDVTEDVLQRLVAPLADESQ